LVNVAADVIGAGVPNVVVVSPAGLQVLETLGNIQSIVSTVTALANTRNEASLFWFVRPARNPE
jgi:microcompartment protein CcmK/EutM